MSGSPGAAGGSRTDRAWQSVLEQLTEEGVLAADQAELMRQRYHEVERAERARTRRMALVELAGYLGAALTIGGVAAITGQVWGDFSEFARILVLAALAAAVLVAAALIAGFAPGGPRGLVRSDQAPRRRLVAVLGTAGAVLTAATMALAYGESLASGAADDWFWTASLAGLAIAVLLVRFAPGVVPTLAVGGFLMATVLLLLQALGWLQRDWAGPLAVMAVAALASLVLVRWLRPAVLVEAVAVLAWLMAAVPMLAAGPSPDGPGSAEAALWVGRIGVLALVATGAWQYARGGEWPWAAAVAAGSAAFVGFTFADALGGAVGMTLAGVVLIVLAVLMLRARRTAQQPEEHGAPRPRG